MTIGTLRQYANAMRDEYCAENGITKAEYEGCYPVESRLLDWERDVERAIAAGETVNRYVLDDIAARDRRFLDHLIHDFRDNLCLRDYMPPEVREFNRQHEADMRAMRRRVRAEIAA